jgi:prepilin-type processing-associated H-X9-DG protein
VQAKKNISALSWAAILLPRLERQDIWDQIVKPPLDASDEPIAVQIPPMEVFVCPSDTEVASQADLPSLSYVANTGAWDLDDSGDFLVGPKKGDTVHNGVFFNLKEYWAQNPPQKAPKSRLGTMKDGAGTTFMFTENLHKSYYATPPGQPLFAWVGNRIAAEPMEQRFGIVWVVPPGADDPPVPDATLQEAINGNVNDLVDFYVNATLINIPRFARPASAHSDGVNVAFCDGHTAFIPEAIDYFVYQQLLTPNGRKCVDPRNHNDVVGTAIEKYRRLPPLSEESYQ